MSQPDAPSTLPTTPTAPTGVRDHAARNRLLERADAAGVRFINLEFTDVVGLAKCVTIPIEQFANCLAGGKWFDGSAIEGLARVIETDMYLRPDPDTFAVIPWQAAGARGAPEVMDETDAKDVSIGRVICDVLMPNGESFEGDPRAVLREALTLAEAQGYRYEVAPELEFFLLNEEPGRAGTPLPHDRGGYFDLSTDLAADVRREMTRELDQVGVAIESSHHEAAAGQHEIDFAPANALTTADGVVTARSAIKAIAQRHGLQATFLPKPFFGVNGSGMHVHQRLLRLGDGANGFADPGDGAYGLSAVGRQFIAGQLAHAAGMSAIIAPLVNSYKRLVPGYEAPVMISWGRVNREALLRAPRVAPGAHEDTRIELRSPDSSCNPYLAFAVMLRAGLDGIARHMAPPEPIEEAFHTLDEQARLRRGILLLPTTLGEALAALQADPLAQEALGQQIAGWFADAKAREWEEYRQQVSPWEIGRYSPLF